MLRVVIMIEEHEGNAKIDMEAQTLKDKKPTPIEVAAFNEMKGRILAKVVQIPKTHQRQIRRRRERGGGNR